MHPLAGGPLFQVHHSNICFCHHVAFSSDSHCHPRRSYKDLCDSIEPMRIMQNNLPISRPLTSSQLQNPFGRVRSHSQVLGIRTGTSFGRHYSPTTCPLRAGGCRCPLGCPFIEPWPTALSLWKVVDSNQGWWPAFLCVHVNTTQFECHMYLGNEVFKGLLRKEHRSVIMRFCLHGAVAAFSPERILTSLKPSRTLVQRPR